MDIEQGDLVFSYLELFVGGKAVLANQAAGAAAPAACGFCYSRRPTTAAVTTLGINSVDTPSSSKIIT